MHHERITKQYVKVVVMFSPTVITMLVVACNRFIGSQDLFETVMPARLSILYLCKSIV